MIRSRGARITGFAVAVGATAALIAFGVSSTGAYFTDSHDGSINATTGKVQVSVDNVTLNFHGLLPDQFQTKTINYVGRGSGPEDLWLVMPAGSAYALNGVAGGTGGHSALGRYGHFAVAGPEGTYFTSFNLATHGTGVHDGPSCGVDGNGHGGSSAEATDKTDFIDFCPVPSAILLHSGLNYGDTGWATITFGYTRLLKGPQDTNVGVVAPFKIVATQAGILPSDPNN